MASAPGAQLLNLTGEALRALRRVAQRSLRNAVCNEKIWGCAVKDVSFVVRCVLFAHQALTACKAATRDGDLTRNVRSNRAH